MHLTDKAEPISDAADPVVLLVDDHEIELDLMQRWCERAGYQTRVYADPVLLLNSITTDTTGCVVADLRMPQISGLELQAEMARRGLDLPVILVTGHGDAENCRAAFQQGVFDFIEKGFDASHFISSVEKALHANLRHRFRQRVRTEALHLLESVSKRELEVVRLLGNGMPLKGIATELDISVQTASKHRSSIFSKLNVSNEVELYKLLLAADVSLDVDLLRVSEPASY